ncbi:MAG: succinate dehydrogenase, hydrophobic membrane anchor protein [Pseudomonadota bacterium]
MSMKSPLGKALGLGSAKEGTEHWWTQRVSAVAMAPLMLWFVISMLVLPAYDYSAVSAWLAAPVNAVLMLLASFTLLYHSALGTQVVIEDYVKGPAKVVTLILVRFAYFILGAAAIFAILRVSLGAPS